MTFYGRRKSEDHQPFKFRILRIVIITQSNARQTAFNLVETESPQTEVVISLPILRKDREGQYTKKVRELKAKMKKYCTQKNIKTIENENITEEGLGMKGLHLNKRGVAKLAHNFLDFLNNN